MKVYGCWICYNNIFTIGRSLSSVLPFIDEAIVIDGNFAGEISDDGTWEAVEAILKKSSKPYRHVKSQAKTLFDKHNEHVEITGNKNQSIYTWQVDSDEIYTAESAKEIRNAISTNSFNGIGIKLITVNYIDKGVAYCPKDLFEVDTTQMRVYRMAGGLHFKTIDGIFEHICYEDGTPVQRQDNFIGYNNHKYQVFNYHCMESTVKALNRLKHYKDSNPAKTFLNSKSPEINTTIFKHHPMDDIWRA